MKNIFKKLSIPFSSLISHFSSPKGFSLIEVILAAAVFVTFATAATVAVISGFNTNRLGAEVTIGNQYNAEGIEAVRSIKNQSFATLASKAGLGNQGLAVSGGVWTFSGTSNTLSSDTRFSRSVAVTSVQRDVSGNIVTSGGTVDSNTYKVVSTTSWNFNSARPESAIFSTYLTNWETPIIGNNGDGVIIYGDTTSVAQPKYRTFTDSSNSFSSEANAGSGFTDTIVGKNFFVQTNPTKLEAVAGYVNNSGVLRVLCFDGSTWSNEWTATVGGTGTNDGRFGIAFEKTSGDAMVVYSTNTATTNEMAYRIKAGSAGCGSANWSAATNIDAVRTSGVVHWIRMENSPVSGSNTIGIAWADANSDLSAMEWTGSSWAIAEPTAALETNLERVSASQDVLSFDIAFESTSGNLMVVWGLSQATNCNAGAIIATTNCIRYARYTTSWSAVAVIPTVADPATNIDIAANPNSNEFVLAAVDNSQADLSQAYWSGSSWSGKANQDTTAQAVTAGSKRVATGWLISGATTRSITVYNDAATTNIGWVVGTTGSTFTTQTDFAPTPVFANPQQWYRIDMDPNDKDRLLFTLSDNGSDLFAKRLVMTATPAFTWSNSDGSTALETSLGQATSRPYGFGYWRNP